MFKEKKQSNKNTLRKCNRREYFPTHFMTPALPFYKKTISFYFIRKTKTTKSMSFMYLAEKSMGSVSKNS